MISDLRFKLLHILTWACADSENEAWKNTSWKAIREKSGFEKSRELLKLKEKTKQLGLAAEVSNTMWLPRFW